MSTPPGSYDNLDAIDAASVAAPAIPPAGGPDPSSQIITLAPAVQPPPQGGGLYVTKDDALLLTVINSDPANTLMGVGIRLLMPDGTIQVMQESAPGITATRAFQQFLYNLPESWILSIAIFSLTSLGVRGRTFTSLTIQRGVTSGAVGYGTLICGYTSLGYAPQWPDQHIESSLEGPGFVYDTAPANPPAGAGFTVTVPVHARWELRTLRFILTASGVAATRTVLIGIADAAGNAFFGCQAVVTQTAGQGISYTLSAAPNTPHVGGDYEMSLPASLPLLPGDVLTVTVQGIDPGDQISAIVYRVEEWIQGVTG